MVYSPPSAAAKSNGLSVFESLALSIFLLGGWIAASWYAVIGLSRLFPDYPGLGSQYLPYIALSLGIFCLVVNVRLFERAKELVECQYQRSTSFLAGFLGYILLITIVGTVILGLVSAQQLFGSK